MKSLSARPAGTARRIVVAATAGAAALSLLGGCGFAERQQAAAIVDGQTVTQDEVREAQEQLASVKFDLPQTEVLAGLIAAPLLDKALAPTGGLKPDSSYASIASSIPDISDATRRYLGAVTTVTGESMTAEQIEAYRKAIAAADVSVNPRFGAFEPSDKGPAYFQLGAKTPDWIKPEANPAPAEPAGS